MTDSAEDKIQSHMNSAYERWQQKGAAGESWSQQQFWDQLDYKERVSVYFGNLNYQVGNGGYMQWIGNRYCQRDVVEFMLRHVEQMDISPAQKVVRNHLMKVNTFGKENGWKDLDYSEDLDFLEGMDSEYYAVMDAFLEEVTAKFL